MPHLFSCTNEKNPKKPISKRSSEKNGLTFFSDFFRQEPAAALNQTLDVFFLRREMNLRLIMGD